MENRMFTCFIRYKVDPDKLDEFREYAHSWISLIRKYGGIHHGYFLPGRKGDNLPDATFSFPGLGTEGPSNIAVALFSFTSIEAYDKYRRDVSEDEACKAATSRFNETKCFSSYERTFLLPIFE
jgi:NIPSNAP